MARPILNKKTVNGKLTYYVNGTAYTNKDKARSAVNKAYKSGADAETKKAKEMRKLIEDQLKLDEPKKPTAKELQAQAIERIRKGEGTLSDSLTANIVPKDVQQARQDVKPKKEQTLNQKLSKISTEINKIEQMRDNDLITPKEAKAQKNMLLVEAENLKKMDPIAIKRDSLLKVLTDTLKTPVKVEEQSPAKVFKSLNKDQIKEVKRLMHSIQSANPKLRKMERLEQALRQLEHIK